jgi:peptidoglycan glycosyltransferase
VNKPIRVVSVFCLVLFLALLVNATYLMYVRSDDLG